MLQNAYLDAKIGFDTEENEPPKVWGELFIIHYSLFIIHSPPWSRQRDLAVVLDVADHRHAGRRTCVTAGEFVRRHRRFRN